MLNVIKKRCPNFGSRNGYTPEVIVVHTMDGTLVGTDATFADPSSKVSAHYGISQRGEVHQYVDESMAAWHAGKVDKPSWSLIKPAINPNLYTVGIEHEGTATSVWSIEMKRASAQLIYDTCTRWDIPLDRAHVIGHYEINSVTRPDCPGKNKAIIDELVSMAQSILITTKINQAAALLHQAMAHIKEIKLC